MYFIVYVNLDLEIKLVDKIVVISVDKIRDKIRRRGYSKQQFEIYFSKFC